MINPRAPQRRRPGVFAILVVILAVMFGTSGASSGDAASTPKEKGATIQGSSIFNYDSTVDINAIGVERSYDATGYANFHTWAYGDMLREVKCMSSNMILQPSSES